MDKIVRCVDVNQDGNIQFTEFLIAASNKNMLLTEENLRRTFDFMDSNKDKQICRKDLAKFMFGFPEVARLERTEIGRNFTYLLCMIQDETEGMQELESINFGDFYSVMTKLLERERLQGLDRKMSIDSGT